MRAAMARKQATDHATEHSQERALEQIDRSDWAAAFEENGLAFLQQDETAEGEESRFWGPISR